MTHPSLKSDADSPEQRLVLTKRPLRSGANRLRLSIFADNIWDLSPAMFEEHETKVSFGFAAFPSGWRPTVKEYVWQLINDLDAPSLPGSAPEARISLRTIGQVRSPLLRIIRWLEDSGIEGMDLLGAAQLDRLLAHIGALNASHSVKSGMIVELRRIWSRRTTLPKRLALPPARPWLYQRTEDLLNSNARASENRTPRISDDTLVPLLAWAIRLIQSLSDDIINAFHEYLVLARRTPLDRAAGSAPASSEGNRQERLARAIEALRSAGLGIPGRVHSDGSRSIRWAYLGRLTDSNDVAHKQYDRQILESCGLPIDDDAYLMTPLTGTLDGKAWRKSPIRYDEAAKLAEVLSTACFVVISYLSGMRPGEVLSLTRGCATHDSKRDIWLLTGTHWKGVSHPSGGKNPQGEIRQIPWVVHPLVADAVAVLEQLHSELLLFPRLLKPLGARRHHRSEPLGWRLGGAKTTSRIGTDLVRLMEWVNEECAATGDQMRIPDDPDGRLSPSRFRRTLAWHIVRRPRGLVAAAIQYGHIATHITQGYSGTYAAGFKDELALERWLEQVENLESVEEYLDNGGTVSGPASSEFTTRARAAHAKFAGRILPTARQARLLLNDPTLQVYPGRGMHCVFDSSKALCATGDETEPLLGECRSGCSNIARTDDDVEALEFQAQRLAAVAENDQLAPGARYQRVALVLRPIGAAIDNHRRAAGDVG